MEFSIVEGKKLNSINYISDGYRYNKYNESKGTIYLRCTLARSHGCSATAKIPDTGILLIITKTHDHSQIEHQTDTIILANRIKRVAETSTENFREIFNTECRSSSGASSLSFKTIESTLSKRRRIDLPKLPSSAEEFSELVIQSPFSSNHRLTIREGNETAVLFASDQMIAKLKVAETVHFDATFKVVPRIFYQLLTIFIRYEGHVIPALHILMSAKSEELYTAVLSAVHSFIPDFNPSMAVCDFEKAPRNAFKTVFPYTTIVGCWFHFTQAVYHKVKELGLCKLYKVNNEFKKWIHQLMSLPFLTEEDIRPIYIAIKLSTELNDLELKIVGSFKKYFLKTWIDGSESLSIFYYEFNTNNGAESYHKKLKSSIKTNHPNIWKFLSSLENIMTDNDLEIRRLDNGLTITRTPKAKILLNNKLRTEYKTRYLNGTYTPIQYLKCISSTVGIENKRAISTPEGESQAEIDSSSDEFGSDSKCYVCLLERKENFSLLHEGFAHAGFCEKCANEINRLNQDCPICRGKINGVIKIFL